MNDWVDKQEQGREEYKFSNCSPFVIRIGGGGEILCFFIILTSKEGVSGLSYLPDGRGIRATPIEKPWGSVSQQGCLPLIL